MNSEISKTSQPTNPVSTPQHLVIDSDIKPGTPSSRITEKEPGRYTNSVFALCFDCKEAMNLFCMTCKKETCMSCSIKTHQGHPIQRIHDDLYLMKQTAAKLTKDKKDYEANLMRSLQEIQEIGAEINAIEEGNERDIRVSIQSLIDYLNDLLGRRKLFVEICPSFKDISTLLSARLESTIKEIESFKRSSVEMDECKKKLDTDFFIENRELMDRFNKAKDPCKNLDEKWRNIQGENSLFKVMAEGFFETIKSVSMSEMLTQYVGTVISTRLTLRFPEPVFVERNSREVLQSSQIQPPQQPNSAASTKKASQPIQNLNDSIVSPKTIPGSGSQKPGSQKPGTQAVQLKASLLSTK